MPSPEPGSGDALAVGLFGTFQQAATEGASTATIWSRLRQAVGTLPFGQQPRNAKGQFISVEENGAERLSQMGIGIQQVNTMRAAAGAWLSAKQRLNALGMHESITAQHIFRSPWSQTGIGRANPPQYRIRILRRIAAMDGMTPPSEEWATYDLGGSLGTLSQVIARSNQAYGRARYSAGSFIDSVLQYEIEVI